MLGFLLFILATLLLKGCESSESIEVFAEAGSQAILPCKWNPPKLSPAIVWRNNKGSIWRMVMSGLQFRSPNWASHMRCPHTQFDKGEYSLHIDSVREEDAGLYTCTLGFESTRPSVKTTLVMLRVIKASITPMVPIAGENVVISCSVTPWLTGARVQWTLNNSPYEPQNEFRNDSNHIALTKKATESLEGNWTCVISYKGRDGRASALLGLEGIIQPPKDNIKVYAAVGSAVRLPCVFSTGLTPTNLLWERVDNISLGRLPSSFSPPSSHGSTWDKSASLTEVRVEDEGWYRCSGTAQGQRLSRNMKLVTIKIDINTSSKTEKPLRKLTCQLSDNSEITEHEWVYVTSDLNGTQFIASVQKGETVTLSQKSDDKWGEWTCRFYGKQGLLGNVTYYMHQMEGQTGQKSGGVSHNSAVLVGLSLLLFVFLLALAQMYKNHQRRKRTFQYPALESIVHNISNEREMKGRNQAKK